MMTTVEAQVAEALAEGQFELHFQPQVALSTGRLTGVEGLIRLRRGGMLVAASQFIPFLERTPLIHSLGLRMFAEGCAAATRWPGLTVAVNMSPAQFESPFLVRDLVAIADRSGANRRHVEIEITEGSVFTSPDRAESMLGELRQAGFAVALDDFGTGYSNFSLLKRFPIDRIKLDKSLTEDIAENPKAAVIVRALVGLSHALDMTVVAEGVEHPAQERALHMIGCDYGQGFRYGRAVPPGEIDALLDARLAFLDQPVQATAVPIA